MEKLSLQEIISAVHGSYGYPADVEISDISTDTRTIKPGSLFIALKGENFDGHNFAANKCLKSRGVPCKFFQKCRTTFSYIDEVRQPIPKISCRSGSIQNSSAGTFCTTR